MSADLHLYVFDPEKLDPSIITDWQNAEYVINEDGSYDPEDTERVQAIGERYSEAVFGIIDSTGAWRNVEGDIWIGQVSWGKVGFGLGSYRDFVPRSVEYLGKFYAARGGIVTITEANIPAILTAFNLPHDSIYERRVNGRKSRGVNKARNIKKFLEANIGKTTFVGGM